MQATSGEQSIVDIGLTVNTNNEIIPSILAAKAASGCDTVAPYLGVGKASIVKKLRMGKELKLLGNTEACIDEIVNETATLISSCYEFKTSNMTNCRINSWYQKISKARKSAHFSKPYHQCMKHLEKCKACPFSDGCPFLWMGA